MIASRRRPWTGRVALLFGTLAVASGCAPSIVPAGPPTTPPTVASDALIADDGTRLPLHVWPANPKIDAVIVALHGFNDYGTFIKDAAAYWSKRGIATYAYDQRGFGDAPNRGLWAGRDAYARDLRAAVRAVGVRHPNVPLFVLGDSMGGAVALTAMAEPDPPRTAGTILVAPAVWARSTMPFYQRWALAISAYTVPWLTVTGRGLDIVPSDNIEMLRALARDPKVIKATRIDAIWGLANLMDAGLAAAASFDAPALVLYGARDEIITAGPTRAMLARLPDHAEARRTVIRYEDGYHMLLRDLQAERVWRDIAQWIGRRAERSAAAGVLLYPARGLR